jgi:hypothetical protein
MIGLLKLNQLLNSPVHREILGKDYDIDDRWFQLRMGDIDVLRPKAAAMMEHQKSRLSHAWTRLSIKFQRG